MGVSEMMLFTPWVRPKVLEALDPNSATHQPEQNDSLQNGNEHGKVCHGLTHVERIWRFKVLNNEPLLTSAKRS
jgi:hypothetical protein